MERHLGYHASILGVWQELPEQSTRISIGSAETPAVPAA